MLAAICKLFKSSNSPQGYQPSVMLAGHLGTVNIVRFNIGNSSLASGGDDEQVRIWSLRSSKCVQVIEDSVIQWGQITALEFINLERTGFPKDSLCFGTGRGQFLIYSRNRDSENYLKFQQLNVFHPGESVECVAYDSIHRRLAIAGHYGRLKVFKIEHNALTMLWGTAYSDRIPRALRFTNQGNLIWCYLLDTGEIHCRDAETSQEKLTKQLRTPIGNVDIDRNTMNLVVDNMTTGFDIYMHGSHTIKKGFSVETTHRYVKDVRFTESGSVFVGGSDHGDVYIFDVSTGRIRQVLRHGRGDEVVQAIDVASTKEEHMIATSSSNGTHGIRIWKKQSHRTRESESNAAENTSVGVINVVAFIVVLVLFLGIWLPEATRHYHVFAQRQVSSVASKFAKTPDTEAASDAPTIFDLINTLDEDTLRKIWQMGPPLSQGELSEFASGQKSNHDLVG